jgi:uncharacterized membrane protein YhiD involved in acid resistance
MLPPDIANTASELIQYRHLGFENFDFRVLLVILGRVGMAALLGGLIAYRPWRYFMHWYFERTESGAQVLIAVAGALMTSVIGNNVALAFGLVGLGGFIRFRSGIKDPREAGVMFLMIGIGMASGIGKMPLALIATISAFILLSLLDMIERSRRSEGKRRIRLTGVQQPRDFEPRLRQLLSKQATVRGSKISVRRDEVTVDVYGDRFTSAGEVLALLVDADIEFQGDIACEEI